MDEVCSRENQWEYRTAPLDDYVGLTVDAILPVKDVWTPVGTWSVYLADIAILSKDGTVTHIFNGENVSLPLAQVTNPAYESSFSAVVETASFPANPTTKFYLSDHLGTTQMEFASGGWPVWKGEFTPFGQELDTQYTANNYKFAGMERDSESDLDHTQFRQYASVQGRWLSPDPYNGSYDLSNPQSFNRYSYVGNMPLGFTDPSGLLTNGEYCGNACKNPGIGDEIGKAVIGGGIGYLIYKGISSLVGMFDTPNCNSCDHPRPDIGNGQWDGNFGESLGLPVNGPQLGGGGVGGFFGLPSGCEFGPCGGGGFGFQQSGNYPNVGVNCRGIETYHLGLIFAQHCDATVSIGDGWLYSLSAGPIDGRLRGFVTKTHTLPTGAINFWKGRDGLGLAKCLISAASASQASPDAPEYHPVYGPNSNIWLNGIFSSCGVNLGIKTHGPYF